MPTYKEVSKIKRELIIKRESSINNNLNKQQAELYDSLLKDFIKVASSKIDGKPVNVNQLIAQFKKFYKENFVDIMKQTVDASKSLTDLNQMYFATLLNSNRLDQIHNTTKSIIDKRLGIDPNGKLKQGGFIDKAIDNKKIQVKFAKEVNSILSGNPDMLTMQNKLKDFIIGNKKDSGLLESHYRTVSKDLLNSIDNGNSLIYADELQLNSFFYSGGLMTTSRSFCQTKNGKIFTRSEAQKWKDSKFIMDMYGDNIDEYDPFNLPGGYGCNHTQDWITDELAKQLKPENNARAKSRNDSFKNRNDL
jgi:hypothetical protein